MNSYILIGIESFIDHIGSIRDLGIAYWKKANKKILKGKKLIKQELKENKKEKKLN